MQFRQCWRNLFRYMAVGLACETYYLSMCQLHICECKISDNNKFSAFLQISFPNSKFDVELLLNVLAGEGGTKMEGRMDIFWYLTLKYLHSLNGIFMWFWLWLCDCDNLRIQSIAHHKLTQCANRNANKTLWTNVL